MSNENEVNADRNGGPAFPSLKYQAVEAGQEIGEYATFDGMTLRDWFAGRALSGMLAYSAVNPSRGNFVENCSPINAARQAYEYAAAMLEARKEEPTP